MPGGERQGTGGSSGHVLCGAETDRDYQRDYAAPPSHSTRRRACARPSEVVGVETLDVATSAPSNPIPEEIRDVHLLCALRSGMKHFADPFDCRLNHRRPARALRRAGRDEAPMCSKPGCHMAPLPRWQRRSQPTVRETPLRRSCRPVRSGVIVPGERFELSRSVSSRGV